MNLVCMSCYHEFEGSISYDELGWHSSCPECGCSFDVDLPEGEIVMAFADNSSADGQYENFTADFHFASLISYYAFSTREEFLRKWEEIVYNENADGVWYWIVEGDHDITFGYPDPGDIQIICDSWELEVEKYFDVWECLKAAYASCGVNIDEH